MPEISKSSSLRNAGIGGLILSIFSGGVEILKNFTELLEKWPRFQQSWDAVPSLLRWGAILGFGVAGLAVVWSASRKRSRLRRPEKFNLDPDEPRHLKGREQDVTELLETCVSCALVKLTGESGSGKTALVRSGLIRSAETDKRLRAFYLDSYGRDWVNGPLENLAGVLQQNLTQEEREKLQLDHSIRAQDVLPVLAAFPNKVGRVPLLIFDQFDDYQSAHRREFRNSKGNWLKPTTVSKNNSFWSSLGQQLDLKQLRILFVSRADMADALHAVEFCESEGRRIDRLGAQHLVSLLDELSPPGEEPPVVEYPEAGWDADLQEVYDTERHLLYVACTRARDHLLVTSVGPASEFLDDLRK